MSQSNEQLAAAVGASKSLLRKRLNDAKSVLKTFLAREFSKPTFDFANKRLLSNDKKLALVWQIRTRPDQPESYENQQTNRGTVSLFIVG
jgi:hypothetical protein